MACCSCTRRTLGLFIRSFLDIESPLVARSAARSCQSSRFFATARRLQDAQDEPVASPHSTTKTKAGFKRLRKSEDMTKSSPVNHFTTEPPRHKERWQEQKAAIKEKLGGEAWNPRKKLSPDTMEGIRHLHQTAPERFTSAVLAQHFKVSPEAIRRILKSKWQPSDEEQEERLKRWDKRGEVIWSNLVELGVKPPKRWRQMGVGRARGGETPKWKGRDRNRVQVQDSFSEELIPVVEKSGERARPHWQNTTISERLN